MSSDNAASHDAYPTHCENCGAPLQGHYCHDCGQSVVNPVRHAAHVMEEVFEAFWHLDGRIFARCATCFRRAASPSTTFPASARSTSRRCGCSSC